MTVILEHLYKYEHFRESETMGNSWIDSIDNSRIQLEWLFNNSPSLKRKAQEEIDRARFSKKMPVYYPADFRI
jgi:hypothetical protein